jgi:hypothetical protein
MSQSRQERQQEIPRIGVYNPFLEVLGVKAYWGNYYHTFGLAIG